MKPIRVLLADDHTLVRAGLRTLIQTLVGMEVVGETGDGQEVLSMVEKHRPNVILMDIAMPGLNGIEVASRVTKDHTDVKVIILSMHATEEYVLQAMRAGAKGYLLKDSATVELELALRAVMKGETFLSPSVSRHVVEGYVRGKAGEEGSLEMLTPRQREILQLIAEGNTTKEIAVKLNLSVKTVETHRTQLMDRLSIHDVAGLVRYAIRVGLVTAND
ncbi:MAG: response regulator transcription factor [Acidobacteriota bacterium]